jgi:hypothetical protein
LGLVSPQKYKELTAKKVEKKRGKREMDAITTSFN